GDRDVAAHRLTVNDGPARLAEFLDEARPQRPHVLEEPVGAVTPAAVAGGGPGVIAVGQVAVERLGARGAAAGGLPLIAMREHDEPAIPRRGHADQILGAVLDTLV